MEVKRTWLQSISLGLTIATIAGTVLAVVPATNAFISDTKVYLSFVAALAAMGIFLFHSAKRQAFELVLNPLVVAMLLFAATAGASTFLTNQYPVENLLSMGGVFLAVSLFAVFAGTTLPKRVVEPVLQTMAIVASVLTLSSILQALGYGPAQVINSMFGASLPTNLVFNLTGSSLIALQFIVVTLVGVIVAIVTKKHVNKVFAITLPIMVIGAALHAWTLLPGKVAAIQLPSWAASWSVTLDAIRSPRSALIGVGPAAYRNVYSQFKPLWLNTTEEWSLVYNQAANAPFTILTTMGFLGLLAWLLIVLKTVRLTHTVTKESKPLLVMLLAILLLQVLLPLNVVMLTVQGVLIAALVAAEKDKHAFARLKALSVRVIGRNQANRVLSSDSRSPITLYAGLGASGVVVLLLLYFVGRSYAALVEEQLATRAATANDAVGVYEHQQKAVALNPYLDSLRRNYAVTNMLIASALSNKTDITEAETQQVGQLLQQAVREARSATLLDGGDAQNWTTLAQIYQNMIGVSEDAAEWSVQSYVAAIEANPTDPNLRLSLGGLFMSQEAFSQAASIFQQTASIKPDYAPTYYNLASALVALEDWVTAQAALEETLKYLDPNSADYAQVQKELEPIKAKADEVRAQQEEAAAQQEATTGEETPLSTQIKAPSIIDQNLSGPDGIENNPSSDVTLSETGPEPTESATPQETVLPTP